MRKVPFYIVLMLLLLCGCKGERMYSRLMEIRTIAIDHPDSALTLLDSLKPQMAEWPKSDRMRYELVRMMTENNAGVVFKSDSLVNILTDYYKDGSSNDRLLVYFLQGKVYRNIGESPQAIQCFYKALEQADTTSQECDFDVLERVYNNMRQIFHRQNLPQDEIWACRQLARCAQRVGDLYIAAWAEVNMVQPYWLLGEEDRVLRTIQDGYQRFRQLGYPEDAAYYFKTAAYIYTERNEFDKARKALEIFEKESGCFNADGEIKKGEEHYYVIKGHYYLAINENDSAVACFRKAIRGNEGGQCYMGMAEIYRRKRNIDSAVYYSKLNDEEQISIRNKMRTDAIRQMGALYNYNRIQKMAEQEAEKSRTARVRIKRLSFFTLMVIGSFLFFFVRYQKRKQKRIQMLDEALKATEIERRNVQEELSKLKAKDYDNLIREKEQKVKELSQTIEGLQSEGAMPVVVNSIEHFSSSKVAVLFAKKANDKLTKSVPTEAEWRMLISQFGKDMPAAFGIMENGENLSPQELRVCILLLLGYPEKTIASLLATSSQVVTTSKARVNKKLFGNEEAKTLKKNLISALKHV